MRLSSQVAAAPLRKGKLVDDDPPMLIGEY
jgi:hypothetical protein